jgi:uncharacterized membrane protein YkvA (DUF1232 family)
MWWLWLLAAVVVLLVAGTIVALALRRDPLAREVLAQLRQLGWRQRFRVARGIARDPRVPYAARLLPLFLAAYLVFPFDLIPDFIPALGQLDDLLVVSIVLWVLLRLVPESVLREHLASEASQR